MQLNFPVSGSSAEIKRLNCQNVHFTNFYDSWTYCMSKARSTSNSRTIQLQGVPDGLEIRQTFSRRRPFTSIPLIRTGNSRSSEPDLLDLLGNLSKGARDFFLKIKCNMNYRTHTAVLPNKGLSQSQINKRSTAIRELENAGKGMACRVPTSGVTNREGVEQRYRPSTFMLSPGYIYPGRNFEEEIWHTWEQCTGESLTLAMQEYVASDDLDSDLLHNWDQQDRQPQNVGKKPTTSLFKEPLPYSEKSDRPGLLTGVVKPRN